MRDVSKTLIPSGRRLQKPHLPRSEPRLRELLAYFLSRGFSEVHGTFRVMWPCPSVDLRFAVCMSELMSATSNTPSCWAIDTRAPLFGIVILLSALMESSCHRLLRDLPATREGLYPHFYASASEIARIKILNSTPNHNHPGKGDFRSTRWGVLRSQEPLIGTG
jgi:hypothetical protein